MRHYNLLLLLAILFLLAACNFKSKKTYVEDIAQPELAPLDSGVINYKDKQPFDTLLHLTGKKILLSDSILKEIEFISFVDDKVVLRKKCEYNTTKFPVGNDEFICIRPFDSLIIRASSDGYSKKIYYLTLQPNNEKLMVDTSKNRIVFAYNYYRVFHVMDMDAKTVKTIDFEGGNYNYKFTTFMDGVDKNNIYYVDSFAGDEYFYLLYWGHSYFELYKNIYKGWIKARNGDYLKPENYQWNLPNIVEQYDWNGNPVGKYLLEGNPITNEGCFVVDEKNQRFYFLVSEWDRLYTVAVISSLVCSQKSLIAYDF